MDRFRYYYEVANDIVSKFLLKEEETVPPEDSSQTETPDAAPSEEKTPDNAGETPADSPNTSQEGADGSKINNSEDKIDDAIIIKKIDDKVNVTIAEQIDKLSIKVLEKKKKIETIRDAVNFLNIVDDTKPNKYSKEEDYKKLNDFLTSDEYTNISVSNLFGIHNALKENFKFVQKEYKDKKENTKMEDLKNIAKKAKRARFTKNIKSLNKKINQIKNNLNNLNQIFNLKKFHKYPITLQKQVKIAQKNASEFIKKLS